MFGPPILRNKQPKNRGLDCHIPLSYSLNPHVLHRFYVQMNIPPVIVAKIPMLIDVHCFNHSIYISFLLLVKSHGLLLIHFKPQFRPIKSQCSLVKPATISAENQMIYYLYLNLDAAWYFTTYLID